jgi:hypothetical protein
MQFNPILKFLSHILLWLIPACLLWWVSANSIIIPCLRVVVAKTASIWFYKEQVKLYDAPGDKWFIRTNLLAKSQPQDGNRHRRWTIYFKPILIYTIGFPLLWAWFLATPGRRIFNQIVGNSIIFLLTALAIWLKVFYIVANVMASGATTQYMTNFGMLQPVPHYGLWLVGLMAHIQFLVSFFAGGIAVPLIWYAFNRDFIRVLLLLNTRSEEPFQYH